MIIVGRIELASWDHGKRAEKRDRHISGFFLP